MGAVARTDAEIWALMNKAAGAMDEGVPGMSHVMDTLAWLTDSDQPEPQFIHDNYND